MRNRRMRTGEEVIQEVLEYANSSSEVCAVVQTDLVPIRKYLYTYNFYFIVENLDVFEDDAVFEECFGKRILLYRGDKNYPEMFPNTKGHLMVYRDGITLVINAIDKDAFLERYTGKQSFDNVWVGDTFRKLLDKNGILPEIERLEEKKLFLREVPTREAFDCICGEFFWVLKTFTEYTLRQELPSAMFYLNISIRELLNRLLHWYICMQNEEPVEIGVLDSNLEKLLEPEMFELYKKTYPTADYEMLWEAYEAVLQLWSRAGHRIAEHLQIMYPEQTEREMREFIKCLRDEAR